MKWSVGCESRLTLTNSNGNRSMKSRLIRAPPDNSWVLTSFASDPMIARSNSVEIVWSMLGYIIVNKSSYTRGVMTEIYFIKAFVFLFGSSGLKFLNSAHSFSSPNN